MQSTGTTHPLFNRPASFQMRLCSLPLALLPPFFLIAEAIAFVNATASPVLSGALFSTGNRSGTLISESHTARDEERVNGIEDFGWGNKYAYLLAKIKPVLWDRKADSQLELKLAWWRVINKHPDSLYFQLKQADNSDQILSQSWFRLWFRYVELYNWDHPRKKVSVFHMLRRKFTEYRIAVMAEEAKNKGDSIAQNIGTKLQRMQMTYWKDQLHSPSKVYQILQWLPSRRMLLYEETYDIWNIYLSEYLFMEPMPYFDQLRHSFDDRSLSLLLIDSKQSDLRKTMATEFQLELEKVWLRRDVAPDRVFKYLGLDQSPVSLLDNVELESWMRYARMYRKKIEKDVTLDEIDKDVALDEIIASLFNAKEVAKIIQTAKTESGKKLAEHLQKNLLEEKSAAAVP